MKIFLILGFFFTFHSYGCLPNFPLKNGWLGGDAIYSIALSANKHLWLFGDTFIGENRRDASLISNSIAISECKGKKWNINYFWKKSNRLPRSFFKDKIQGQRLWPKDGFIHKGILSIFFTRVKTIDGPIGLNFEVFDTVVIKILNPQDPPNEWKITQKDFLQGGDLIGGTAVFKNKGYLYQFASGTDQSGHSPLYLLRSPLENYLSDIQIYIKDSWRKFSLDLNFKEFPLIHLGAQEVSLHWSPLLGKFEMIIPGSLLTGGAYLWQAKTIEGPWEIKSKEIIYPEMSQLNNGVFCYAAKFHQQFHIYTYACNSFDENVLLDDLRIYRPIVITK